MQPCVIRMLSPSYRLRMEFICDRIASGAEVTLEDRIWASKLAKANRHAATMLRQAQRRLENPDMAEGGLDSFLNALDIGEPGQGAITRFNHPDQITDFFRRDDGDDWRQRD